MTKAGRPLGSINNRTRVIIEMLRYPLPSSTIMKTLECSQQNVARIAKKFSLSLIRSAQVKVVAKSKWDKFNGLIHKTNSCWFWIGRRTAAGYGTFRYRNSSDYAHRLALLYFAGIDASGNAHVMHSCDTPQCVNPNHLRIGTPKENVRDSISKGICRGRKNLENL